MIAKFHFAASAQCPGIWDNWELLLPYNVKMSVVENISIKAPRPSHIEFNNNQQESANNTKPTFQTKNIVQRVSVQMFTATMRH